MHGLCYAHGIVISVENAIVQWHKHVTHDEKVLTKQFDDKDYTPVLVISRGDIDV